MNLFITERCFVLDYLLLELLRKCLDSVCIQTNLKFDLKVDLQIDIKNNNNK